MNAKVGSLSFREQAGEQQYYRPHSDQMTDLIDSEVRALIDKAYQSVTVLPPTALPRPSPELYA